MTPFNENRNEILWNLINCGIAGALVFFGSVASGQVTETGVIASIGASFLTAIIKFKDYWDGEKKEYQNKILTFI